MRRLGSDSLDLVPSRFSPRSSFRKSASPRLRVAQLGRAILLILAVAGMSGWSFAQNFGQTERIVQGRVISSDGHVLSGAVVYLENQKTQEIKTYITETDGNYRFTQLNSDVNYGLWAEYKGHKSKTSSISSFDSKKQFTFELKVPTK